MSGSDTVLYEKKGKLAVIKLNRPELNLIDGTILNKLSESLKDAEGDQSIRCILFMGAGKKAFSAGIDLKYVSSLPKDGQLKFAEQTNEVVYRIAKSSKPTVAALHGHAIGLGYMIAMASDIRVAAANTVFKIPEVELGMFPGSGLTVVSLKNAFPPSHLLELVLTCKEFDANKADRLGLINRVVSEEELEETAFSLAKKISLADPAIATPIKKLIRCYPAMGFDEAEKKETELHFEYMKRRFQAK
jgi:enoyl-CoA hydratase/carnithine racemase